MRSFEGILIDYRSERLMFDACRAQHLAANDARRGEDQGQTDNLVEKRWRRRSANMGMHSIGTLFGTALRLFDNPSTGGEFDPQPVSPG